MKLQSTTTQFKTGTNEEESSLIITVDYNPEYDEVEGIISVQVYSYKTNSYTDITGIMHDVFWKQLNDMIYGDQINWLEIYCEKRREMLERA